jgi:hypothetical protein
MYHEVPYTPRALLDTEKGKYREFRFLTKPGSADCSASSKKQIKIKSPRSRTHLSNNKRNSPE